MPHQNHHPNCRLQVDPFDPNSPIKQSAISRFPPDMFFVLRVVQLLRGLADGAGGWGGSDCGCKCKCNITASASMTTHTCLQFYVNMHVFTCLQAKKLE